MWQQSERSKHFRAWQERHPFLFVLIMWVLAIGPWLAFAVSKGSWPIAAFLVALLPFTQVYVRFIFRASRKRIPGSDQQ